MTCVPKNFCDLKGVTTTRAQNYTPQLEALRVPLIVSPSSFTITLPPAALCQPTEGKHYRCLLQKCEQQQETHNY